MNAQKTWLIRDIFYILLTRVGLARVRLFAVYDTIGIFGLVEKMTFHTSRCRSDNHRR